MKFLPTVTAMFLATVFSIGPAFSIGTAAAEEPKEYKLKIPAGLEKLKMVIPEENPLTSEKIELGKQLYFDDRLSGDNTVSCASCHDPKQGWSNGEQFATGVRGQVGGRNAPTIINSAYVVDQFWDGRAHLLEGQALGPIENPIEMDLKLDALMVKLNKIEGYRKQFQEIFGTDATKEGVAHAIASFERTILSGDAPYDRFKAGDKTALSEAAQRGLVIFNKKAQCSACHSGANFTNHAFENIGVGMDQEEPDLGRYAVLEDKKDKGYLKGAFRTPTLREIAKTAPYMHDGSEATLEDVVEFYDKGGVNNPQLSEDIFPLKLTDQEKKDLVIFMKEGLSSPSYPDVEAPELPK